MIRLLFISLLFIACKANSTQSAGANYYEQIKQAQPDSLLAGVQNKIYNAFVQSLMSGDNHSLLKLSKELEELNQTKKQHLISYWRAYLQFYSSIYYLKKEDEKNAEKEIDKGVDWMKRMENKNSEDYALLAMLQSFGIQFKKMQAMFISGSIKKNAKQAIAIDSANLRAYYVYANNDFYTPEKYGGKKEAEKYLLKAIALPAQKVKNEYLPSWGKEESYEMLIKLYIEKEKWTPAKKYFQEGIEAFPESYTISQLGAKLVGK